MPMAASKADQRCESRQQVCGKAFRSVPLGHGIFEQFEGMKGQVPVDRGNFTAQGRNQIRWIARLRADDQRH